MPKLTDAEKERRKHERKAVRMNDAERKSYGPLFAHMATTYTVADAERRNRIQKACAAEMCLHAANAMDRLCVSAIERHVRELRPAEAEDAIATVRRMHEGSPHQQYSRWRDVLVHGHKMPITLVRIFREEWKNEYNREGIRIVVEREFPHDGAPLISAEEFDTRYPSNFFLGEGDVDAEDDPTGLFPRVMAMLPGG